MQKKFPPEFKGDVVRVARRGDLTVPEEAIDFGVSEESVRRWVRQADIDDGVTGGQTSTEQTELVQLRRDKRRLEMENLGIAVPLSRFTRTKGAARTAGTADRTLSGPGRTSSSEVFPPDRSCRRHQAATVDRSSSGQPTRRKQM